MKILSSTIEKVVFCSMTVTNTQIFNEPIVIIKLIDKPSFTFQPSFTELAPGYGVRRVNMLDRRVESFVSLHKEPIRDLAFNPVFQVSFKQSCCELSWSSG